MNAVTEGHLDLLRWFFQTGVDINFRHRRSLFYAAVNGHLDIVKFLVKNGADVNAKLNDFDKRTALDGAILRGDSEIVKFLVENGAYVNARVLNEARKWKRSSIANFLKGDSSYAKTLLG